MVEARYPRSTLDALLRTATQAFAGSPAILAPGREPLTYAALGAHIDETVRALARAGYGHRSRVAVALPDGPESVVAVLGVGCGSTCAPLSPDLDEDALVRLLVAMRIDALVALEGAPSAATRAARRAGAAQIALRPVASGPAGTFALIAPPGRSPVAVDAPGLDEIVLLAHTSGTTAAPKIVPHTQRRIAEAVRARVELGRVTCRDRSLLATPVSNITSLRRVVLPPLIVGGSVICLGRFDMATFIDCLERFAPTHYMASAATQMAILEALERRARPLAHALRFVQSGGANLPADVQSRLGLALGVPVVASYGMTETGNIAQGPLPPEQASEGSAGRPSNVDVSIVDERGAALGADEVGEILVRGPEVFDGYENDPEANARAFRDGWFRTGDLGRIDRDGFLFIVGRVKDVINRGGAKVAPAEVEDVLAGHPQVVQAAAFALPHARLGEDLAAAVVLRRDAAVSENELRDFVRARLAAFKVPTRIVAVASLPRGAFDKLRRDELARIVEQRVRDEFVAPRDPREMAIAATFANVLGIARVGATDNFFQLGGDSLSAMRAVGDVQSAFAIQIRVEQFFANPTAAGLAAMIDAAPSSATPPLAAAAGARRASS